MVLIRRIDEDDEDDDDDSNNNALKMNSVYSSLRVYNKCWCVPGGNRV